jgi:PAS domain S-box-containing protein
MWKSADRLDRRLWILVPALSAVAVGSVFLGRLTFHLPLPAFFVGSPRMTIGTAGSFILTGLSLCLVLARRGSAQAERLRQLARIATWTVLLIAGARFGQYLVGLEPQIRMGGPASTDRVAVAFEQIVTTMAVPTAVAFILSSTALLYITTRQRHQMRPAMLVLLGIVVAALGMASFIPYAIGFIAAPNMSSMAASTAGLFMLMGVGILAYGWQESGQAWFLSRGLTASFVASGTVILAVSMIAYRISTEELRENIRLTESLQQELRAPRWENSMRAREQLSQETMEEIRHVLFAGIFFGLGLFAGVLWLLNREVAERRNTELALRESEERFRQMAENLDCVFWMSNAELKEFFYVSPACERVWGRSAASLHSERESFITTIHPDDRERVSAQLRQKQFIHKAGFELEYRVLGQGRVRWVRDRAFPVLDQGGNLTRLVGIAEDVTERKEAETAARISQERFRSVWERSADGMRLTDAEGRIVAVNEAYCRLVKLPRDKLEGRVFSVVYDGHGPSDGIEVYRQRFENGDIVPRLSARVTLWNCHEVEMEISNSFLELGEHGRILLSIFRDVGDRRVLEEQLRQSQKMEAVGRLAGGVAHDFNNLLVVMRTHAELLLMDGRRKLEEVKDNLQQITNAADRAANLTRQLLAFSRKQVMQSRPLALNDVIANLTKMLNRIIGEDIHLECRYGGGLPLVQADAGMLEQIVVNLVVNGRDAMPQGGKLQIATEKVFLDDSRQRANPEARPGEFVCLTVGDTGTGIAPEHLGRIFEPFFTTKELGKGTGLGLATVYGIAKQHQGWIEVTSKVGQGTTFKVFFPALPSASVAPPRKDTEMRVRGGKERILLVEDDFCVRLAIKESLERHGYKIQEASCAREALDAWRNCKGEIDLLLTDIVMPEGVTGRELAEEIRTNKPGIGVIFMSGYSADIAGKDTGFFRRNKTMFLQKPFPAPTLLDAVRRCVEGHAESLSC